MANVIIGDSPGCGIQKKILFGARGELKDFPDGTRVRYKLFYIDTGITRARLFDDLLIF